MKIWMNSLCICLLKLSNTNVLKAVLSQSFSSIYYLFFILSILSILSTLCLCLRHSSHRERAYFLLIFWWDWLLFAAQLFKPSVAFFVCHRLSCIVFSHILLMSLFHFHWYAKYIPFIFSLNGFDKWSNNICKSQYIIVCCFLCPWYSQRFPKTTSPLPSISSSFYFSCPPFLSI